VQPDRDNRRSGTLLLALLVCAALTAVHKQSQRQGLSDPVSGIVRDMGLIPAQTLTARFGDWWQGSVGSFFIAPRLARENAALQTQIVALTTQNRNLLLAQSENSRLRALLEFKQKSPYSLFAAEVVALKPNPQTDTLVLNRGLASGVRLQSIVLAPNGALVGQVVEVSAHSCTVLLLTDAQSSVGVLVNNHTPHGPVGLCQGDGQGHLQLTYLRSDTLLHPGDSAVTSGLGGIFPKDLPLGTVTTIQIDTTRSLKTATLHPAADFDHLEEVFLLRPPAPINET